MKRVSIREARLRSFGGDLGRRLQSRYDSGSNLLCRSQTNRCWWQRQPVLDHGYRAGVNVRNELTSRLAGQPARLQSRPKPHHKRS
jgi:hypothetical protein